LFGIQLPLTVSPPGIQGPEKKSHEGKVDTRILSAPAVRNGQTAVYSRIQDAKTVTSRKNTLALEIGTLESKIR
jgi:hypothetical protein